MGLTERKENQRIHRRQSIMETAKSLIEEKSYEQITMDEIAKKLELARPTLYIYFRNKSEIYCALLTRGLNMLRESYDRALKDSPEDPKEQLRRIAVAFFEFYVHNHFYFDLLVTKRSEMLEDISEMALVEFEKSAVNAIQPVTDIYEKGVQKGLLRGETPEKMAFLLRAVAIGIAVGFRDGTLNFPDDIPLVREMVFHGIAASNK